MKITARDVNGFLNRAKGHFAAGSAVGYSEVIGKGESFGIYEDRFTYLVVDPDSYEVREKVIKNWRGKSPTMILMELNRKDFTVNDVVSAALRKGFAVDSKAKL